jgi:glycosidase
MILKRSIQVVLLSILIVSCKQGGKVGQSGKEMQYAVFTTVDHPAWSENAVIYEVNIRQYTEEGTFKAFTAHLPRLQKLGVDIVWLMPVHPVGEKNRKGSLGSYYSVRDYHAVNPEYGTMDELKELVAEAHEQGMHVLLDWVANHTAWDNPLIYDHPEWYEKDSAGNIFSPFDWTDVAQLDYDNDSLRMYMTDALKFWVREADIDGYRCDVAGMVPCDFWNDVRASLDSIKPVFMLAEDEANTCLTETAFDMNYAWELHHILNEVAKKEMTVQDIKDYFMRQDSTYDPDIYRMNFITNHDENSWNGTEFERMGDAVEVMALLTFTVPGMPLLYSGQEIGMKKRLEFFEKDAIEWKESEWEKIYQKFIKLKKSNKVLWNGKAGGTMHLVEIPGADDVFAFIRAGDEEALLVITNLSGTQVEFQLPDGVADKKYKDVFTGEMFHADLPVKLGSYKYIVLKENMQE